MVPGCPGGVHQIQEYPSVPKHPYTIQVSYPRSVVDIEVEGSLSGGIVPKVRNREPQPKSRIIKREKASWPAYNTRGRWPIQAEDLNRND